ncbi:MAG TPA: hemerythrin family protein [Bacillota bacterium]|jgi:hemerythrin|nr:hemerythrin family protein [Bacillota bacterium]
MMWKEKYKIGVELIDGQHRELFRRVSDFVKTVQSEDKWDEKLSKVKETLEFMKAYVITHFDDEEAYQKEIGYPEYERHRQIHQRFKDEVQKYAEKFQEESYSEETVQEFGGKLMAWLINHVAGEDQKIGDFQNRGGSV